MKENKGIVKLPSELMNVTFTCDDCGHDLYYASVFPADGEVFFKVVECSKCKERREMARTISCPECGHPKTKILKEVAHKVLNHVLIFRECEDPECCHRFTTREEEGGPVHYVT